MSVKDTHPDYDKFLPLWQRAADCVEGQTAIHLAGERYLAKLGDETGEQYQARLARSDFFNATWRTIAGLTGMAFAKPPATDLPAALEAYAKDINLEGTSLDALARDLVGEVHEFGRMGIMVDMPPKPENVTGLTQAASEALGLRPMIKIYEARHIINWRFGRVRNAWVLVQIVLTEACSIAEDEFEHKSETRYRVLDLDERGIYRQRLFRINKHGDDEQVGDDIYPMIAGKPMSFVPFTFVGPGGKADAIDTPPLIDLIDANIAHYQINADYRHALHFTGLPTPWVAGYSPAVPGERLGIGSLNILAFDNPDTKIGYLEFTGQGLTELREALNGMQKRMAILGARMLTDETRHAQTLGEAQIKHLGENSILATVVIAVSEAIEWALGIMAMWIGASGAIKYQINRDFMPQPLDAQTLTALVGAWQSGALSDAELFGNLQRGDLIDAQKSLELHQEEVASASMPAPVTGAGDKQAA